MEMKTKVLVGMLCLGLLGFAACDKDDDDITPSPPTAGVSSNDDASGTPSDNSIEMEEGLTGFDNRKLVDERVNINGKYVISYFEDGTPDGGVDVTSQYQGYIFTINNGKLTVTGNGVNLEGSIRVDEDKSYVQIILPSYDQLQDIDPVWMLNDISPFMIGMASVGMDAPRDAMVLSRMPELRNPAQVRDR